MRKLFVLVFAISGCVSAEPEIDPELFTMEIISSDSENVTFEIKNNSKGSIEFGEDYCIEFKDGENWVPVEEISEYFFNMIAYGLESGGSKRFTVNFEPRYGALSSGTYRVAKDIRMLNEDGIDCGGQRVYAEFEIVAIER